MQNPLKEWGGKISSHPLFWKMDPVLFPWHWLMLVSVTQHDAVMEELFRLKLHLLFSERLQAWCHTPLHLLVWRERSAMVCGRSKSYGNDIGVKRRLCSGVWENESHGNESNAEWRAGVRQSSPCYVLVGTGVAAPLSRCRMKQWMLLTVPGSNQTKRVWRWGKIRGSYMGWDKIWYYLKVKRIWQDTSAYMEYRNSRSLTLQKFE